MSIVSNFSKKVYYARKDLGLTQEQTAEALGISVRWYQDIENGKHIPSGDLTLKIMAFYGIDGKSLRDSEQENVFISSNTGKSV